MSDALLKRTVSAFQDGLKVKNDPAQFERQMRSAVYFSGMLLDQADSILREQGYILHELSLEMLGKYEEALEFSSEAIEFYPNNEGHHIFKAEILIELFRFSEAVNTVSQFLSVKPESVDCYLKRSNALCLSGNLQAALDDALTALVINGVHVVEKPGTGGHKYERCFNAIGRVFYLMKDLRRAQRSFVEAVKIDPLNANSLANLAYAYAMDHSLDTALDVATKGLAIDFNEPLLHAARGDIVNLLGRRDEAISEYNVVNKLCLNVRFPLKKQLLLVVAERGLKSLDSDPGTFYEQKARDKGLNLDYLVF